MMRLPISILRAGRKLVRSRRIHETRNLALLTTIAVAFAAGCIGTRTQHELAIDPENAAATPSAAAAPERSDNPQPAASDAAAAQETDTPRPTGDSAKPASPLTPFDNFHVVAKDRAYRSGQLTAEKLRHAIETYGIKTVVNLRGPNAGSEWYDEEKRACEAAGVRMVDVPLSAGSLPSKENVLTLFDLFQDSTAEPLLIHCRGGADRSGMISAMWRMEVAGDDEAAALRELTWVYGHFPARYPNMTAFIRMFEPSREWIEQEYNPTGGGEMTDE